MFDSEGDIIRRRLSGLSEEAQSVWRDMMEASKSGEEPDMNSPEAEALFARMEALDPAEQAALLEMLHSVNYASDRLLEESQMELELIRGAQEVFKAAHEKLRSEGKPIDPDMTLEDAYRILEVSK